MVKYITKSHKATINTNGMLLDEERLRVFVEHGLDNISISIDGFAKEFDKARGHPGLFDRIVKNINKLNEIKKKLNSTKPTLTIKAVLLDECVDELEEFYEFCNEELLADNLNISFSKTTNHAQFDTRILKEWKDVAVLSKSKKDWQAYYKIKNSLADLRPPFAGTTHKAQGGTFPAVFIDKVNINKCRDPITRARLFYVALTRASKNVYINS